MLVVVPEARQQPDFSDGDELRAAIEVGARAAPSIPSRTGLTTKNRAQRSDDAAGEWLVIPSASNSTPAALRRWRSFNALELEDRDSSVTDGIQSVGSFIEDELMHVHRSFVLMDHLPLLQFVEAHEARVVAA